VFDSLTIRDAVGITFLKRGILALMSVFLVIGAISSYRAYVQVYSLDITASDRLLRSGSTIKYAVVISGRTQVDVQVELIQGGHVEEISNLFLRGNELAFFDPRSQHASQTVVLTKELLNRFQPGVARLRATATGREQWTRLPPPTVRELDVEIQPDMIAKVESDHSEEVNPKVVVSFGSRRVKRGIITETGAKRLHVNPNASEKTQANAWEVRAVASVPLCTKRRNTTDVSRWIVHVQPNKRPTD